MQAGTHQDEADCIDWDPTHIWIEPSLMEEALVLTAIPAFIVGDVVVHGFARLGISEVTTFMAIMPVCITLWFFSLGWLLDGWRWKRGGRLAASSS
jgi:hypothetical protein